MVDALRQSAAALPQLVVFSEALTDMIRGADGGWIDRPGGGGWNAARVASRLGVRTAFAGAISADYFGNAISDGSLAAGLDPRFMQRVTRVPLLAMVTSIEPPTYQFIGNNSADLAFDPSLLPENWLAEAKIIQFGGISLARAPLADRLLVVATQAADASCCIALDPNFRAAACDAMYHKRVYAIAERSRFIKVSDDDLAGLFPQLDASAAIAELQRIAPAAEILLTLGASGMQLFSAANRYECAAYTTRVVDTVGCGDAAMGSWTASQIRDPEGSPVVHLHRAAAAAAIAASRRGAYAPTVQELQEFLDAQDVIQD
jgi:fructokinase